MPCRLRRRSRLLRGRRRNLPSNVGVIPTAPRAHNSPACQQARHGQQRALTGVCQCGAEHNDGPGDAVCLKSSSSSFVHFNAHVHSTIMCPRATGNGHVSARNKSKTKRWIVQLVVSSPDSPLERASPQKAPHVAPHDVIQRARGLTLELEASACEPRASWAAPGPSAGSRNLMWRRSCSSSTGLPTLSLCSLALRCFTL
jgi:hypothetical protein